MRDYGKVSTSIWNSRKFGKITDDARLLYLYLHTCPHVNSVGCFVLKDGYAAADLRWPPERYIEALHSLSKAYLVGFDRVENLVRLVNFLKFDPFTNPKHAQGAIKIALALPDSLEKLNALNDIALCRHAEKAHALQSEIDRLSKAYRNPEPEPEPEPELPSVVSARESAFSPVFAGQQKKAAIPKPEKPSARDILIEVASPEAVDSYMKFRKAGKAKGTTERAAGSIAKQLLAIRDRGGNPDEALDMAQVQGWQGMDADWYFNKRGQGNGNGNSNNGAGNGRGVAGTSKATEIADRATRYAESRAAVGGIDRNAGSGERQN